MAARPVFDYSKLMGRMREYGYSQERLCEEIGLGLTSFSHSVKNRRSFKQDEIVSICNVLDIPLEDMSLYFFKD